MHPVYSWVGYLLPARFFTVEMMIKKNNVNDPGRKSWLTDHPVSTEHYTHCTEAEHVLVRMVRCRHQLIMYKKQR